MKVSNTQVRGIVREASKTGSSASSIRNSIQLIHETRRVPENHVCITEFEV